MARLLIWCFVWIQVHSSKKSSSWKHFWSNGDRGKKVAVTPRRSNVATSSRRDVPASRRWVNNAEVNKWKRRDVPTSRRRLEICTSSFKVRMAQKGGHREAYERRHGIPEQSDTNFEEVPEICTVSQFWIFLDIRMMFLILNIFIFSFGMF